MCVCAYVCRHKHNEGRFQPTLSLNFKTSAQYSSGTTAAAAQHQRTSQGSCTGTPVFPCLTCVTPRTMYKLSFFFYPTFSIRSLLLFAVQYIPYMYELSYSNSYHVPTVWPSVLPILHVRRRQHPYFIPGTWILGMLRLYTKYV